MNGLVVLRVVVVRVVDGLAVLVAIGGLVVVVVILVVVCGLAVLVSAGFVVNGLVVVVVILVAEGLVVVLRVVVVRVVDCLAVVVRVVADCFAVVVVFEVTWLFSVVNTVVIVAEVPFADVTEVVTAAVEFSAEADVFAVVDSG